MLLKSDVVEVRCKGLTILMVRSEIRSLINMIEVIHLYEKDIFAFTINNLDETKTIMLTLDDIIKFENELRGKANE